MKIAIAHAAWMEDRPAALARLLGQLGAEPLPDGRYTNGVEVFASTRPEHAYVWARRLWQWCATQSALTGEPVVCLNDDVEVPQDFAALCEIVHSAAPDEIISLHVQAPGAIELAKRGARWARCYWLTGPAYLLPPGAATSLLEFWDSLPWELATHFNEDNVAIAWAWDQQRPILTTIPALAHHDVGVKSSLGYDKHSYREPSVSFRRWNDVQLESATVPLAWSGMDEIQWALPLTPVPLIENPWRKPRHMTEIRSALRDGLPICSACVSALGVQQFKNGVTLCRGCSKTVSIGFLQAVL